MIAVASLTGFFAVGAAIGLFLLSRALRPRAPEYHELFLNGHGDVVVLRSGTLPQNPSFDDMVFTVPNHTHVAILYSYQLQDQQQRDQIRVLDGTMAGSEGSVWADQVK